jgi:hypothetical protein
MLRVDENKQGGLVSVPDPGNIDFYLTRALIATPPNPIGVSAGGPSVTLPLTYPFLIVASDNNSNTVTLPDGVDNGQILIIFNVGPDSVSMSIGNGGGTTLTLANHQLVALIYVINATYLGWAQLTAPITT